MKQITIFLLVAAALSSCRLSDLRTDYVLENGITQESIVKGKEILDHARIQQGYDRLSEFETYEVIGKDHWKGLLGKTGNPWPINDERVRIRYITGTFDGQFEVLEGNKEGLVAGLQSWNYYEGTREKVEFTKMNKKVKFVLAAYQYFFELPSRLMNAPIISYAGKSTYLNKTYEKVFVTWETAEPNDKFDQYIVWVDNETGLIKYVNYTLRENYLPSPKGFYGTIEYGDYREVEGLKIPFEQQVYFDGLDIDKSYLHKLTVERFEFNSFPKEELRIDKTIEVIGDSKPHISVR